MRAEFAHEQAQTYLRQRNRFAVLAGVLGLTTLVSLGAAVTRDEQVVLQSVRSDDAQMQVLLAMRRLLHHVLGRARMQKLRLYSSLRLTS